MKLNKSQNLSLIVALSMLIMPLVLILLNGEVPKSISHCVYTNPITFCFFLSIGGFAYFQKGFESRKSRFDMLIGLSLWGVIFTPCDDYTVLHYTFAGIFFLGNSFNIVYYSNTLDRWYKSIFSLLVLLALSGFFIFGWFNLFIAEWIGIVPQLINFTLEELEITD